ncbi:oligopeptide ABC transporter permease [Heyndrickxia sp. NPDC080065]|uniref:oligopeptide ABC transporter permease n=1 Tax=Heyndrickxia sp. NPDC080065 TaxID=3390568 RepID=UPI003CFC81A1
MSQTNLVPVKTELLGIKQQADTMTKIFFRKFMKNKLAVLSAIVLFIIISATIFAPLIAPYSPDKQSLFEKLSPPSGKYIFGADTFGRDIFSRLLYGARVSLLVGFASVIGSLTIGTIVGAISGYFGGWLDGFFMRVVDIILSIPQIFLLITLVTIFEPGVDKIILIFAILGWTGTARLVRGEFLSLRSREYVLAAKTIGVKSYKIIFSHILPNAMGPIIVSATLAVGNVILAEAVLSFLGLGIQPPTPSWGNMLEDAKNFTILVKAWWYPLFPGLLILITVLCFNFLGDGLRDATDPRIND